MKKTRILTPPPFPAWVEEHLRGGLLYDSSCSPEARVYYAEKENGIFIKTAAAGTLKKEALMTEYFHKKGLGPAVIDYRTEGVDYLLTERVRGEDLTSERYLSDPRRLCDTLAVTLRALHERDFSDCPVMDRNAEYLALAEKNYRTGNYDTSHFPDSFGYRSPEEAYAVLQSGREGLCGRVLLHGDYCLPNLLFEDWRFTGFIDLGAAGVGDRHIDLFWGAWTLWFNLKTDEYRNRFFDAYGRELVNEELVKTVAAAEVFG